MMRSKTGTNDAKTAGDYLAGKYKIFNT